ncbi:MAG: ribulose-phosphate 3-epimerase [Anaerorhabdus sp.]
MIIAPSVLSLDYSRFNEQLDLIHQSKATWLHFDVMDGHFVPNLTFGPDILKAFKKSSSLFLDVHLMVSDPVMFSSVFIEAGADCITFHYEALKSDEEIVELIHKIKEKNCKVGMSIKPKTSTDVLTPILPLIDLVLVMSVEPGFGGQPFMTESLERIKALKNKINELGCKTQIEVDGGINKETGKYCAEAGADILVAGSYIFKQDIIEAVESLC